MKISIVTVCYNNEQICFAIESVLRQTYSNIEYIIIDGNSQDQTVSIIKSYEPKFLGRLKWISEPDMGIYDAMNKGIRIATGDVIGIINSDDFFTSSNVIERIVNAFENFEIDAVYGDIHYVSALDLNRVVRKYSSRIFRRSLIKLGFMPAHPSFYMKRSCYEKYGLYDTSYKICADFELLLRYIYIYRIKTHYLPMDCVTMRLGGVSTSGISAHRTIMKEHLRAFKENGLYTNRFLLAMRYLYKLTEIKYWK
jgi:glycosyltransferase involved in cell wall biosynthesis